MTRTEKLFTGAAIILLPFVFYWHGITDGIREPKAEFLVTLMGLFIAAKLFRDVSWSLGGAAGFVYLYSFFLSPVFPKSDLLTLSAALGSCLLIAKATEDDVKFGLELLEATGIAVAAYAMILQLAHKDPIMVMVPGGDFHRVQAFFGQHTLYGPFAVACAAPALFRKRYLRAIFLFSPIIPIDSSFTYLSAAVVIAMFLAFRFGRKAVLGISLVGLLAAGWAGNMYLRGDFLKYEFLNDNGRFAIWKITARIAEARPILGHGGLGTFAEQFQVFERKDLRASLGVDDSKLSPEALIITHDAEYLFHRSGVFFSSHNEFLQVFYEFGLVGLFLAVLLVFTFWWWWSIANPSPEIWALGAIFFSVMANSLGNFPLHLIPQALLPLWAHVIVTTDRDRGII